MNKPVVYVVKEQSIRSGETVSMMNYTPAMKYGELVFITGYDLPAYGRGPATEMWQKDVKDFVEAYDPLKDFIVTTGQPASIFAVGWALGTVKKCPRFLIWRHESASYVPVHFDGSFMFQ